MVAPFKSKEGQKAWLFLKPFTWGMWAVTGATLIYTMFVVWFLEHPSNPEFGGTWGNQVGAALWFTFISIFFAQRERIQSNYTRTVVGVWLVVVFVLTQNYMACFSSVLTVKLWKPEFHDVSWLINTNQKVGCGDDAIVPNYLTAVLGFKNENVITFSSNSFTQNISEKGLVVGFLELPYARILLDQYCKGFTRCSHTYSLAGLGFVSTSYMQPSSLMLTNVVVLRVIGVPKGSVMAEELSKAILYLSHYGILKSLDDKRFSPLPECKNAGKVTERQLSIHGFWVLYLVSGVISNFFFLLFLARFLRASPIHPGSADFVVNEHNVLGGRVEC